MSQNDILVLNQSDALSSKELEAIQRKGFSVSSHIFSEISDLNSIVNALYKPIILVNSGESDSLENFIEEICNNKILQTFPVLFISQDTSGLETRLNRHFPLAVVIQKPADISKTIEAIRFLCRNYRNSNSEETIEGSEETEIEEEVSLESVNANIEAVNNLFSAVKDWNLSQIDLGGYDLPLLLSNCKKQNKEGFTLPQMSDFRLACDNFLSTLRNPAREAIERINSIAMKIIAPLNLAADVVEITQAASILFAQAFAKQHRALLTQEYSFRGAILFRKEICSAVKDSALNIGGELSNRELSKVISTVGKIIGQEESAAEDPYAIASSAIVAADLINRTCYRAFFWNSSAAYGLLRKIRQGRVKGIHPAVICISLKLLAEALSSPLHKKLMASTKSEDEIAEYDKSLHINEEKIVELPELTPGMRLSRPLETEDGKAILEEDLVLDDDLILRIWQLSSIKLINRAVVKRIH